METVSCDGRCPVQATAELIQGKWTTRLIGVLLPGPLRFAALQRQLPGISSKVLSARLHTLLAQDLISRQVLPSVPPGTEYQLTPRGVQLAGVIQSMHAFGQSLLSAEFATLLTGATAPEVSLT